MQTLDAGTDGRVLCALLMSPPRTSGVRTVNMLEAAGRLLHCESVIRVNLFHRPTLDLPDLSATATEATGWHDARPHIDAGLGRASVLLAAWGVVAPSGAARSHHRAQLRWLTDAMLAHGHQVIWTVGGEPRHPSRWHQYVSDRHQRTSGGSTHERLAQVLLPAAITTGGLFSPAKAASATDSEPPWEDRGASPLHPIGHPTCEGVQSPA